ncbi:MAG: hypothetical protein M1839_001992 [Geoglossum umbratile]|nr:MAG: hypothetical protein M1839_001992 [Geoglossum umbratile]
MLSRAASNASARLRRARSSASASGSQHSPSKPDYIDPEVARQHALAAASYAFQRANERGAIGVGGSNGLSRNNSTASAHLGRGRPLSRQRSVRFAGKLAEERRQSIRSRDRVGVARAKSESILSTQRHTRNDVSLQRQRSIIMSITPDDEHCTPEDDVASTPSSYRKLRKAKSMFSPRKQVPNAYGYGSPESDYRVGVRNAGGVAGNEDQSALGEAGLRAPRSMSFLRGGRECVPRPARGGHNAAVQMARRQYFEQLENQRLKARQSFVLSSTARRQQKAFRKTVRTTSQKSYGSGISSSDQQARLAESGPVKSRRFSTRARNLSLTIKETFKRVFHRSSESREGVPVQQIDATRQHFYVSSDADAHGSYGDAPLGLEGTVSRVSSRVPSVQAVPSEMQLKSQAGSIRSVRSEDDHNDTTSYIVSSNSSTAAGSWATRQAAERKRLSIIQESGAGTQKPSSTGGSGAGGYTAIRRPVHTSDGVPSPVDSQRVYSALMKRIDKNRLGSRQGKETHMRAHDYVDPTTTSPAHRMISVSAQRTPTTIRQIVVDSDGERSESHVGVRMTKSVIFRPLPADDVFSPGSLTRTSRVSRSRQVSGSSREEAASRRTSLNYFQVADRSGNETILTPQEAANLNEKMRSGRGHVLREARSTFFPSLGGPHITTPSPYKRALGGLCSENERIAADLAGTTYALQKLRKISENSVPQRQGSIAGCSSVYSRTTSGGTPKLEDGSLFHGRRELSETGTAIIITDHVSRSTAGLVRNPANPFSRHSNEWKSWMSSEIAGLDKQNAEGGGDLKAMGHQREGAQIDGDDTQIGRGEGNPSRQASQLLPLSTVHGNVVTRTAPRYKVPSGVVIPLIDIGSSESMSQQHGPGVRPISSMSTLSGRTYVANNSVTGRLDSASRRDRLRARSTVDMRSRYSPLRTRAFTGEREVVTSGMGLGESVDGGFGRDENNNPVGGGGGGGGGGVEGYEDVEGTGLMGPSVVRAGVGGVVGSQRMVDLFLSSRRRRIRGSDGSGKNAFL